MKKYLFILMLLLAGVNVTAQEFQGVAEYESKTTFDFKTPEGSADMEIDEELKEQLKKAFEKSFTLYFNKTASVYEEDQKLSQPAAGSITVDVSFADGGRQYRNIKDKMYYNESDIFGKEFLIVDALKPFEWKMEGETKKIGSYTCYKATAIIPKKVQDSISDTDKATNLLDVEPKDIIITAWYTPDVPVGHGPGTYWGLPGLILEVNDGHTSLLCSKLTLNPKEKHEIVQPKKGKKVTQAEFDKIIEEKSNEMMQMEETNTGNGTRTTRVFTIGG